LEGFIIEVEVHTTRLPEAAEKQLLLLIEQAKDYSKNAKSANTLKSYRKDWEHFTNWCETFSLNSLPANEDTFALYLSALAIDGYKASTIQRRMSAISVAHSVAGFESPTTSKVKVVWAGIKRSIGTAEKGKLPIVIDTLKAILQTLPQSLSGTRDRALLLIGFAGALRRSELVSLDVNDINITNEGLILNLRSSKTDQEGQGTPIGIPYGEFESSCPVRSYIAWLKASGIEYGPVFRPINRHGQLSDKRLSDRAVALIVKRWISEVGMNESDYSGHSLRSGLATSAAMLGKSERSIMEQTRHTSTTMVRRYIRMGSLFNENAAKNIGL